MRKLLLIPLLLLLVACGTSEAVNETKNENEEMSDETAAVSEAASTSQPAAISADAITPGETPAEAGVIRDRDWTQGAEDPLVTIIEYGDFQ